MREHNQNRRGSNWDKHSRAHGPKMVTCPTCNGHKFVEEWIEMPARRGYFARRTCPTCFGRGKVLKGHFG